MIQYIKYVNSPLGQLTLLSDGISLTGLWIKNQKYYGALIDRPLEKEVPVFIAVEHWLEDYFDGKNPSVSFPIFVQATPFQQIVYDLLLQIPYGQVMTYGQIAQIVAAKTGKKKCAQAIGQAVGHNPISIVIPCHRLIGQDGSLKGYAGGLENKRKLLELENADLKTLYVPDKTGQVSWEREGKI